MIPLEAELHEQPRALRRHVLRHLRLRHRHLRLLLGRLLLVLLPRARDGQLLTAAATFASAFMIAASAARSAASHFSRALAVPAAAAAAACFIFWLRALSRLAVAVGPYRKSPRPRHGAACHRKLLGGRRRRRGGGVVAHQRFAASDFRRNPPKEFRAASGICGTPAPQVAEPGFWERGEQLVDPARAALATLALASPFQNLVSNVAFT